MKTYYYDNKSSIYKNMVLFFNRRPFIKTKCFLLSTYAQFVNKLNDEIAAFVEISTNHTSIIIREDKDKIISISVTKPRISNNTFYNSINHYIVIHEVDCYSDLVAYFSKGVF